MVKDGEAEITGDAVTNRETAAEGAPVLEEAATVKGIAASSPSGERSSEGIIGEIGKEDISPVDGITNFSDG